MIKINTTIGVTLPAMPPLVIETIGDHDLFNMVHEAQFDLGAVGFACGTSLEPKAIVKLGQNNLLEVRASTALPNLLHTKVQSLSDSWPRELEPYTNRYVWLNNYGEILSPIYSAKAIITGRPVYAITGLVDIWKSVQTSKVAVTWDKTGTPRKIGMDALLTMIFATLPIPVIRRVLTQFRVLDQGFLRFYIHEVGQNPDLQMLGHNSLITAARKVGYFSYNPNSTLLQEISQEAWVWSSTPQLT